MATPVSTRLAPNDCARAWTTSLDGGAGGPSRRAKRNSGTMMVRMTESTMATKICGSRSGITIECRDRRQRPRAHQRRQGTGVHPIGDHVRQYGQLLAAHARAPQARGARAAGRPHGDVCSEAKLRRSHSCLTAQLGRVSIGGSAAGSPAAIRTHDAEAVQARLPSPGRLPARRRGGGP